jgi:uncharacterized protein YprB with RNaseH-like and TPR domain
MPSLSEKLKALGVNLGTDGLSPPSRTTKYPIEKIIDGQELNTPLGQTFVVEHTYQSDPRSKDVPLTFSASLSNLSILIDDPNLVRYKAGSFAFLDTETSGLAGGTGTYAFMIGIGKFVEEGFRLSQFFMRDPIEEPAQLAAVLGALDGCKVLVTYNGKSFDVPLLNTRFITNGEPPPLKSFADIDLLHLARRFWRDRLQSRTLGSIEENILGVVRTEEDIPGWMVPTIYFEYIKTGDARPLSNVFYHNAMDILSLATLLNHVSIILDDPHGGLPNVSQKGWNTNCPKKFITRPFKDGLSWKKGVTILKYQFNYGNTRSNMKKYMRMWSWLKYLNTSCEIFLKRFFGQNRLSQLSNLKVSPNLIREFGKHGWNTASTG